MEEENEGEEKAFTRPDEAEEVIEVEEADALLESVDEMYMQKEDEEDEEDQEEMREIVPGRDDSYAVFREHEDEVFCVSVHGDLVASGGKDDTCIVWQLNSQKTLYKLPGHNESVVSVGFNEGGGFLATGDLNGLVQVWSKEEAKQIWSFETSEVQWMKWHHKANLLLCGDSDGNVWLWIVPHDQTKTLPSPGFSSTCGSFFPDGRRVAVGYEDGSLKIWDLKTTSCFFNFDPSPQHHQSAVLNLDCHHGNVMVASGAADGSLMIVNSSNGQILHQSLITSSSSSSSSQNIKAEDEDRIETLIFSSSKSNFNYLIIGTGSGRIVIWDATKQLLRCQMASAHDGDVVKILWHPSSFHHFFSCSVDGSVVLWDARNGTSVKKYLGHKGPILDMTITNDASKLITTSSDRTVRLYLINN